VPKHLSSSQSFALPKLFMLVIAVTAALGPC
jgi:hypothetical protein